MAQMRDLAAAAARIFGWKTDQPKSVTNMLVISHEDLAKIRALRDPSVAFGLVRPSLTTKCGYV
jgi:hypothetical protein